MTMTEDESQRRQDGEATWDDADGVLAAYSR